MTALTAVALDLDGTLLASNGSLSDASVETLREVSAMGHRVVYVTARHLTGAILVADRVGVPADAVCCAGAAIHELPSGETLQEWPLEPEDVRLIAHRLREALPGTSFGWVAQGEACVQAAYPDRLRTARVMGTEECLPQEPVSKLFARNAVAVSDLFWSAAVESAAGLADAVPAFPGFADFIAPGIDKGTSLQAWCRLRGVAPEGVVAFGDSLPDLPMISVAGLGLAVGNAAPEVRAAADAVVASNDDDGVARALRELFQLGGIKPTSVPRHITTGRFTGDMHV